MNTLHATFIAAILSASSTYADATPHWTAAIGTGRASNGNATATLATATGLPSSPHWSASIGTGHATDATSQPFAKSSTSSLVAAAPHWTSKVGTGHAAQSNGRIGSTVIVASRTPSRVDRHQ
jgi:hypothetical protein